MEMQATTARLLQEVTVMPLQLYTWMSPLVMSESFCDSQLVAVSATTVYL